MPKIKKYDYKGAQLTESQLEFNKCLPEDYHVITEPVIGKDLNNLINDIVKNYPSDIAMNTLDNLKELGFKKSTEHGYTLSLSDLYDEEFENYANSLKEEDGIQANLTKITKNKKILEKICKKPYFCYIASGARGSVDQLLQLIIARGYVANSNNQIVNKLLRSSYVSGLNETEFFYSCYGTRKGLMDTATSTAISGFLTRQLVYSNACTELGKSENCGTTDCLELDISIKNKDNQLDISESEKLAKTLLNRYIQVGKNNKLVLITNDNYKALVGKRIALRSPIKCVDKKICKTCYGKNSEITHSDQIGIIAGTALGERTTQLVLRTFHTSFSKDTKLIDINNNYIRMDEAYDRIKSGESIYTLSCSPEGIISASKIIDAFKDHVTDKMIRITLDNDKYVDVTYGHEFMMRNGTYKKSEDLNIGDDLMSLNDQRNVKHIEYITLDKPEAFYDVTVDCEYSNFPLEAGIFVHNSGVVQKQNKKTGKNEDINTGISVLGKLLHNPYKIGIETDRELVLALYNTFREYGYIHMVHYEVVVSSMMWYNNNLWRTLKNRNNYLYKIESILQVPSKSSWLLGVAFSRLKHKLLDGLISGKHDPVTSLGNLFSF